MTTRVPHGFKDFKAWNKIKYILCQKFVIYNIRVKYADVISINV